ncbi:MAG: PDZ domain-containing protein, partial [Bacteroidales bacterium]|nr:PDZ domain-containing protein [Bacteroidales bacterium]
MKVVLTAVLIILLHALPFRDSYSQLFNEHTYKFSKVMDWLDSYYVDSINQKEIVEGAIKSVLQDLDPHSVYISAEEVQRMNEPLQGNFEGIGISFHILFDTIYVISPISGGPSENVGILAGDRIIMVEGKPIAGIGLTNTDVFDLLRGPKGTKVTLSVKRQGVNKLIDFTITRDKIPIFSIDASYMINNNTGYIKISRFAFTTVDEFVEAFGKLKQQGLEHLILDLSENGGGYLDKAVELADHFLDGDKIVVYTEGLNTERKYYKTSSRGVFENGELIVLMDEGSASASEILAGAIQDWDRGLIIGR